MKRELCDRYLEDPEGNASHLADCADCRGLAASLETDVVSAQTRRISTTELPLAAWEGASHKSWPLVASGLVAIAVIALLLCAATGTSPVEVLKGNIPSGDVLTSMVRLAPGFLHNAPASWTVFIVVAFLVVNAIFIALLRRAPRGIDV